MKSTRRTGLINYSRTILFCASFLLFLLLVSCHSNENHKHLLSKEKQEWIDRIYHGNISTDSLQTLLTKSIVEEDNVAISVLCDELGGRMRVASDFSKAIEYHQIGLEAAYVINDTLGITRALNSIATDFRRIGALPEASEYHYQALYMADIFSGKNKDEGRKNRIIAINGLGNVYLSFGNLTEAESLFREALAEEISLGSELGQAINYANIGAIYERREQYDSAYVYYERSMACNISAGSRLGVGLCHIYFGQIHELQQEYDEAEQKYLLAYEVMSEISDTWHGLEATLALARIRLLKRDYTQSLQFIYQARDEAEGIQSPMHLSQVYGLLHEYNIRRGNYAAALDDFKISKEYEDTIQNMKKLNKVIETRLGFERDKHQQYVSNLNLRNEMEARQKQTIIYASIVSLGLLILSLIALFYAYMQRTSSNKVLRRLNRLRTDFFTNVTHEFRTPLTVILGLSNQLQAQKEITPAETHSYLRAIDRQGRHLLSLVNQLLSMSKINAGMDNPRWQKGNIVVYARMVVESFELYAKNKQLNLTFSSDEPAITMDFIPHYMEHILQNLISNAIKFSHPGGEISVRLSSTDNKTILQVLDNVLGSDKDELERIFDLFYQGDKTEKRNGSGIGLSYTRQMVEMMNGKIEVESQENMGSLFTVSLPRHRSKDIKAQPTIHDKQLPEDAAVPEVSSSVRATRSDVAIPANAGNGEYSRYNATVLLIEDNDDVLLYLKSFFPKEFNVVTARDGAEGMDLAYELIPDIIVSDIMMPKKDGLVFSREIRESELLNHIPVILLTAKSTMDDRLKGLQHGADAYIKKPFDPSELLVQMVALLESRRLLKDKYMHYVLKESATPKKDVNMEFLQKATDIVYSEMHSPHFSVVSLADRLSISSSQLNRKLNAISGHTPSGFIMRLKIERAKKKLTFENKPIGQIAEECGFYDVAYFSRTFKRFTKVSPSQYRRMPR